MYKVFINDRPLFLTNVLEKETNFKYFLLQSVDLKKIIAAYAANKLNGARLYASDEKLLMKQFKEKITVNKAGGGLVTNGKDQVLFIFRNGKWDLPKGGIEKKETMEETAIREVEEETGCKGLKITDKLEKTYHIFKRNGEYRLKVTHWYAMETNYEGPLIGQLDEGIEKAVWINRNDVPTLLSNLYKNIKLLFPDELIINKTKKIKTHF